MPSRFAEWPALNSRLSVSGSQFVVCGKMVQISLRASEFLKVLVPQHTTPRKGFCGDGINRSVDDRVVHVAYLRPQMYVRV
jgi:hypothetical protein